MRWHVYLRETMILPRLTRERSVSNAGDVGCSLKFVFEHGIGQMKPKQTRPQMARIMTHSEHDHNQKGRNGL